MSAAVVATIGGGLLGSAVGVGLAGEAIGTVAASALGGALGGFLGGGIGGEISGKGWNQGAKAGAIGGGLGGLGEGLFGGPGVAGALAGETGSPAGTAGTAASAADIGSNIASAGTGESGSLLAGIPGAGVAPAPFASADAFASNVGTNALTDTAASSSGGLLSDVVNFAKQNPSTLLKVGSTLYSAAKTPQLPGYAQQVGNESAQIGANATGQYLAGGQPTPTQLAAINSSIDQQIQQNTAAIQQHAANSGLGPDSLVVQQQIQAMTEQLNTQRSQLLLQAQQGNLNTALSALNISGSQAANIAGQQFRADTQAQSLAQQLAGAVGGSLGSGG